MGLSMFVPLEGKLFALLFCNITINRIPSYSSCSFKRISCEVVLLTSSICNLLSSICINEVL